MRIAMSHREVRLRALKQAKTRDRRHRATGSRVEIRDAHRYAPLLPQHAGDTLSDLRALKQRDRYRPRAEFARLSRLAAPSLRVTSFCGRPRLHIAAPRPGRPSREGRSRVFVVVARTLHCLRCPRHGVAHRARDGGQGGPPAERPQAAAHACHRWHSPHGLADQDVVLQPDGGASALRRRN